MRRMAPFSVKVQFLSDGRATVRGSSSGSSQRPTRPVGNSQARDFPEDVQHLKFPHWIHSRRGRERRGVW